MYLFQVLKHPRPKQKPQALSTIRVSANDENSEIQPGCSPYLGQLNYQDPDPTQYGWIIGRSTEHLVADLANKEEELGTLVEAVTVTCSCSTKSVKNKFKFANLAI